MFREFVVLRVATTYKKLKGAVSINPRCKKHSKNLFNSKFKYRAFKKDFCECCGFVATHPVQLDVDHVDGNHDNNEESNLQTLCANCHRLKTFLNGDHLSK